ncbi:peptidoglycan-associated lipoprotein Pal [candidate division KSB1 bacterium]|nr:peptidoglycan-associated lipoprotein Pal [candidate division KSB1 bacterium]
MLSLITVNSCSKKVTQTSPAAQETVPVSTEPAARKTTTETSITETTESTVAKSELIFQDVNFDFDKYDLRLDALEILADHAQLLREYPDIRLKIEGHCDEWGTIEYNLALGDKRANIVRNYLINYGIDPARLSTISYGKERPLDSRSTEEAWAKNRRAAFVIIR